MRPQRSTRASGGFHKSRIQRTQERLEEEEKDTCAENSQSARSREIDGLGTFELKQQGDLHTCAISGEGLAVLWSVKKLSPGTPMVSELREKWGSSVGAPGGTSWGQGAHHTTLQPISRLSLPPCQSEALLLCNGPCNAS